MTTPNRKRIRLVEKLKELKSTLVIIKEAPAHGANPAHPEFDPTVMYVSRRTLIELLENNWVPGPMDPSDPYAGYGLGSGGKRKPINEDLANDLEYDRAAQAADCTHRRGSDGFCKKCHVALKA